MVGAQVVSPGSGVSLRGSSVLFVVFVFIGERIGFVHQFVGGDREKGG